MRMKTQMTLVFAAVLMAACGGRIPPEVTLKSDVFVGSWIKESDFKANIDAADGGKDKITVINVSSLGVEVSEEIRVPGEKAPAAYPVGRLKVSMKSGEAQIVFDAPQMKEQKEKVGARSDEEINRMVKAEVTLIVSPDRNRANIVHKDSGVEKSEVTQYVKINSEQREKLKLNAKPTKPTPPAAAKPAGGK